MFVGQKKVLCAMLGLHYKQSCRVLRSNIFLSLELIIFLTISMECLICVFKHLFKCNAFALIIPDQKIDNATLTKNNPIVFDLTIP